MDFTYLKNFMDELVDKGIPGNGAIVYKDGKKVFEYASGYASIEEKTPMGTNIPINIYSCSKPMTVVAALQYALAVSGNIHSCKRRAYIFATPGII